MAEQTETCVHCRTKIYFDKDAGKQGLWLAFDGPEWGEHYCRTYPGGVASIFHQPAPPIPSTQFGGVNEMVPGVGVNMEKDVPPAPIPSTTEARGIQLGLEDVRAGRIRSLAEIEAELDLSTNSAAKGDHMLSSSAGTTTAFIKDVTVSHSLPAPAPATPPEPYVRSASGTSPEDLEQIRQTIHNRAELKRAERVAATPPDRHGAINRQAAQDAGVYDKVVLPEETATQKGPALESQECGPEETFLPAGGHQRASDCPTYYDGCHCTVETLVHNYTRAEEAEAKLSAAEQRNEELEGALREFRRIAAVAYDAWDADNDSHAGRMLRAMSGLQPGYMAEIDAIHAALSVPAQTKETE